MARRTRWIDHHVAETIATAGQANTSLWGNVLQNDIRAGTITRVVGSLQMVSTSIAGAYGVQEIAIGFGVVGQQAFNEGSPSLPNPMVMSEFPVRGWIWRTSHMVMQNGVGINGLTSVSFDLRAQRKIDDGEFAAIIVNGNVLGTAFTIRIHGNVRTLVLLP